MGRLRKIGDARREVYSHPPPTTNRSLAISHLLPKHKLSSIIHPLPKDASPSISQTGGQSTPVENCIMHKGTPYAFTTRCFNAASTESMLSSLYGTEWKHPDKAFYGGYWRPNGDKSSVWEEGADTYFKDWEEREWRMTRRMR